MISINVVTGTFENVDELTAYLKNITDKNINIRLECDVTDTEGELEIPNNVQSIYSDKKVCTSVNRTNGISINLPEINS